MAKKQKSFADKADKASASGYVKYVKSVLEMQAVIQFMLSM